MKLTIENPVQALTTESYYQKACRELSDIIQMIASSHSEREVKNGFAHLVGDGRNTCFEHGYGGNHLWVKQLNPINKKYTVGGNIIFCTFN